MKSTLLANAGGIAMFGIVFALSGDRWKALGTMLFVVAVSAAPALIPSFRLGWRRFTTFWTIAVIGTAVVAALVRWAMTNLF